MDHVQFKTREFAANYVANALDEQSQELFELHMMGCPDCVEDVEAWRAIKLHMSAEQAAPRTYMSQRRNWWGGWGIAASVVAATLTAVVGWEARGLYDPGVDSTRTAVFNAPPVTRSGDCTPLRYAEGTRSVVLRVPSVASGTRVVATDVDGQELIGSYTSRQQADGSWVLKFDRNSIEGRAVRVEARSDAGDAEALACITGVSVTGD